MHHVGAEVRERAAEFLEFPTLTAAPDELLQSSFVHTVL